MSRTPITTRLRAAAACLRGQIQCERSTLPWRRAGETVKFELTGTGIRYHASFSRYEDGRLAEVFIAAAKTGELARSINRDGAIAASLALQYGCPVETLRDAMGRSDRGEPESPLAAALDIATGRRVMP